MFGTLKLGFVVDILTLFNLDTVLATFSKVWAIFFQPSGRLDLSIGHLLFYQRGTAIGQINSNLLELRQTVNL
jgi:hypothetical protein